MIWVSCSQEGVAAMAKKRKGRGGQKRNNRRDKAKQKQPAALPDRRAAEGVMRQMTPAAMKTKSSLAAAQDIMYQAFDCDSPRQQLALALKALEVCEDCADAYVLLAERAPSLPSALELYEQGVAAGERAWARTASASSKGIFGAFWKLALTCAPKGSRRMPLGRRASGGSGRPLRRAVAVESRGQSRHPLPAGLDAVGTGTTRRT